MRSLRAAARRPFADTGSATVWVLVLAAVLVAAGIAVTLVLGVVIAHRRVVTAADLAALGAAGRLVESRGSACRAAADVAAANGAALVSCRIEGGSVVVSVRVVIDCCSSHHSARFRLLR